MVVSWNKKEKNTEKRKEIGSTWDEDEAWERRGEQAWISDVGDG